MGRFAPQRYYFSVNKWNLAQTPPLGKSPWVQLTADNPVFHMQRYGPRQQPNAQTSQHAACTAVLGKARTP